MEFPTSRPIALPLSATKWAAVLLGTMSIVTLVFVMMPEIDLNASRAFFDDTRTFHLASSEILTLIRGLNDWILIGGLCVAVIGLVMFSRTDQPRAFDFLFPILVYAVGPGLVVNWMLKNGMGRARPRDVLHFGGEKSFTHAWELSTECIRNCSFTSGEAASAVAMLSLVTIIPSTRRRARQAVAALFVVLALAFSLNRIAFGAHFLSDTLMSMLLVALVMLIVHCALQVLLQSMNRKGSAPG